MACEQVKRRAAAAGAEPATRTARPSTTTPPSEALDLDAIAAVVPPAMTCVEPLLTGLPDR